MHAFAVLCLAAVALARPQEYSNGNGAVTTVTERTFTIRGESDKYYGNNNYASGASASGVSAYSAGASGYSSAQPSYSFETVAQAVPVAQQSYQQSYQYQAAPAVSYQAVTAAPAVAYQAAPAVAYQAAYQAAPAVAYQAASYQAAPAVAYQAAAPAVTYTAVTPAPAVAYQAVTAAPAVAYQAVSAAPAYQANYAYRGNLASSVGVRSEDNYASNNYDSTYQNSQVAEEKVYKHVYAFAAPEEPAVRASVRVQAPVNKKKHYKLIFIKAPSQQTVVDSDITLPAQEEEKTLIYVLSKNQKQVQPEIRIKQAQSSKHAKPEVFFLKYKNEQEAQAIASGAISGQNADVPAQGEIISDGSVSLLGKSSSFGSSGSSSFGSSGSSSFGSSGSSNFGSSFASSAPAFGSSSYRSGSGASGFSFGANVGNSYDSASYRSGLSAVSAGTVGLVPSTAVVSSPVAIVGNAGASGFSGAGLSSGFSAYKSASSSYNQEPASVAIKVTSEPEVSTTSSLSL